MRLSEYILSHMEKVLADWDDFARRNAPEGTDLSDLILRDHAREMLEAIAADVESKQSARQQQDKSEGSVDNVGPESAAAIHGALRHEHEFSLLQLSAEFRALRATVLRLWLPTVDAIHDGTVQEIIRFNEAIDQALAESIIAYVRESDEARQLLLAVLGHDLRSPLSNMALAGDLLSMTDLRIEQVPKVAASVQRGARLMQAMVDDLLGYTRTQLGRRLPMTREHCDLGDVLRAALSDAQASHPATRYEVDTADPLAGCYDATRLHQLFLNLLANAGQHGAKTHPVTVVARGEGARIVVRITNHGPHIAEADLESIFKPLVRLGPSELTDTRPRTSLGLGLFIAREIAESHGGSVSVTSDPDDGTTFTVELPRGGQMVGPGAVERDVALQAGPVT